MGGNESRSEPYTSILVGGTVPDYHNGCPETADTAQYPGLLVIKSSTLSENATTLASAANGIAADKRTLYQIEIPRSNPTFPKSYDKDTAFPVSGAGSTYQMHELAIGDRVWLKGSSLSADENNYAILANGGLVSIAAATTEDEHGHAFLVKGTWSSATWIIGEYQGPSVYFDKA